MISKVKITTETIKDLTDQQLDEAVYNKAADLYLGILANPSSRPALMNCLKRFLQ